MTSKAMENRKKLQAVRELAEKFAPKLPYHNFGHALGVRSAARKLSKFEKISAHKQFLLETAALLHDVIYVVGKKDNEEQSAAFARKYLPDLGYSVQETEEVANLILATKSGLAKLENKFQGLLRDADTFSVGTKSFFVQGNKLRQELGISSEADWLSRQINFLRSHKYHTNSAKKLLDAGQQKNLEKLIVMQATASEVKK